MYILLYKDEVGIDDNFVEICKNKKELKNSLNYYLGDSEKIDSNGLVLLEFDEKDLKKASDFCNTGVPKV